MLSVSRRLQTLLQHSAMTSVYPNFERYIEDTWQIVQTWTLKNGIHTLQFQQWRDFISQQWKQHQNAAWTSIKYRDIAFIRAVTGPLVVHGRDHALSHCHVYCPWRFWKTVRDTFEDPEVYQTCPLERTSLIQFLDSITRRPWLRPHKWGIRKDASLRTAYVLVKQKKQFKAARPIIDYKRFIFAKLFRATAIVLDLLQKECLPQSYGLQTFPKWYRALFSFWNSILRSNNFVRTIRIWLGSLLQFLSIVYCGVLNG